MISPITKTRDPLFDIDDTVPSGWGKMFVGGTHGQSQDWTSMLNRGFGVFALLVCSKCCKISSINNTTHSGRKRNTCHPKVACVRPLPMFACREKQDIPFVKDCRGMRRTQRCPAETAVREGSRLIGSLCFLLRMPGVRLLPGYIIASTGEHRKL